MAKRIKVRQIVTKKPTPVPREVPDCNRPLEADRGVTPGGLPPAGIKPGWQAIRGHGVKYHTHS